MEIIYQTTDPERAKQIVTVIRDAYIGESLRLRTDPAGRTGAWFAEQTTKAREDLAKAEKVGLARMQKMLKLARLAPDIVEDIARGRQPVGLSLLFFVVLGVRLYRQFMAAVKELGDTENRFSTFPSGPGTFGSADVHVGRVGSDGDVAGAGSSPMPRSSAARSRPCWPASSRRSR